MVMISLGDVEGIVLALLMIGLNIYQDKTEPKPMEVAGGSHHQTSAIIIKKGHYFCPTYCEVDHPHRAHSKEYDCESDPCLHFLVKIWEENLLIKLKNTLD
jgi:hypothetical protein